MMRMPFGRHKGEWVADLPPDYLAWLFWNVDMREPLKAHVYRAFYRAQDQEPAMPVVEPDEGRVHAIYRRLALKWHPDRGGSNEAMAALNEFYEAIRTDDGPNPF